MRCGRNLYREYDTPKIMECVAMKKLQYNVLKNIILENLSNMLTSLSQKNEINLLLS